MKIIGLTGPSGAGKSTVAGFFAAYGIPAIDADRVYHDILAAPGPCTDELTAAFGRDVLNESGLVDRKKLGAAVFGRPDTPARLHTLNGITHKYVMAKVREETENYRRNGVRAVLFDAPQLFEAGADRTCDLVIGVLADKTHRLRRIMRRDGIDEAAALARLAAQKDDDFYRARCDLVLENNGDESIVAAEVRDFLIRSGVGLS